MASKEQPLSTFPFPAFLILLEQGCALKNLGNSL